MNNQETKLWSHIIWPQLKSTLHLYLLCPHDCKCQITFMVHKEVCHLKIKHKGDCSEPRSCCWRYTVAYLTYWRRKWAGGPRAACCLAKSPGPQSLHPIFITGTLSANWCWNPLEISESETWTDKEHFPGPAASLDLIILFSPESVPWWLTNQSFWLQTMLAVQITGTTDFSFKSCLLIISSSYRKLSDVYCDPGLLILGVYLTYMSTFPHSQPSPNGFPVASLCVYAV